MASSASITHVQTERCSLCKHSDRSTRRVWLCLHCDRLICEPCWPKVRPAHDTTTRGWRDNEHERVLPTVQRRLDSVFRPNFTEEQLDELHEADQSTTWFGVGKEKGGLAFLSDGGVYESLMLQRDDRSEEKYPQIVSFIGETNAGKSTLIKLLIEFADQQRWSEEQLNFPSPVIAPRTSADATSVDVHMYADPATFMTQNPLLFADSEGLDGGEQVPRGGRTIQGGTRRHALSGGNVWPLMWANGPLKCMRKYTVSELYPRLLYTFSDVVVFVVRNQKTFEERALEPLVKWADTALEKSINQAALPHLIIVNNHVNDHPSSNLWEVEIATARLLERVRNTINLSPQMRRCADVWKRAGIRTRTTHDLLRRYYSSIRVVNVPAEHCGTSRLLRQLKSLNEEITRAAFIGHDKKESIRMISTSQELGMFMQAGFAHFSNSLKIPFDFVQIALKLHPLPKHIGGYMLRLAVEIVKVKRDVDMPWIFSQLSKLIASCILLDCVRTGRRGDPIDYMRTYQEELDGMLKFFCQKHAPCEYSDHRYDCVNSRVTHTKGHQNDRGKVFADGHYRSSFSYQNYRERWAAELEAQITAANEKFQQAMKGAQSRTNPLQWTTGSGSSDSLSQAEQSAVMKSHSDTLATFFADTEQVDTFRTNRTCLCCFVRVPQHVLQCGHALCSACARSWDRDARQSSVVVRGCPLHPEATAGFDEYKINFKPELAGVRVLALDGGGVRGITELKILEAIQQGLGAPNSPKIPLQAFIDLVVGTSTGGLIALAIGSKQWLPSKATATFCDLSKASFTKRAFHGMPVLKQLVYLYHASVYKATPRYAALQEAFGNDPLFGYGAKKQGATYDINVAVTSTSEDGKRPLLLSNYNRSEDSTLTGHFEDDEVLPYDFIRADSPSRELLLWQAGAASSAAPPYFKPFQHSPSFRHFLDGGLHFNNPSRVAKREYELLWPDLKGRPPDVFISLGTGQNQCAVEKELKTTRRREIREQASRHSQPFQDSRAMISSLKGRVESILDAHKAWFDFVDSIPAAAKHRYVRLNPDLGEQTPKLDEISKLERLANITMDKLAEAPLAGYVGRVVQMLMASTFFFRLKSRRPSSSLVAEFDVVGTIACRFEDRHSDLQLLGRYLEARMHRRFRPYFTVSIPHKRILQKHKISSKTTQAMIRRSSWELPSIMLESISDGAMIHIDLCLYENEEQYPISGFPRELSLSCSATPVGSGPRLSNVRPELEDRSRRRTTSNLPSEVVCSDSRPSAFRHVSAPEPIFRTRSEMPGSSSESRVEAQGSIPRPQAPSELPGDNPGVELSAQQRSRASSIARPVAGERPRQSVSQYNASSSFMLPQQPPATRTAPAVPHHMQDQGQNHAFADNGSIPVQPSAAPIPTTRPAQPIPPSAVTTSSRQAAQWTSMWQNRERPEAPRPDPATSTPASAGPSQPRNYSLHPGYAPRQLHHLPSIVSIATSTDSLVPRLINSVSPAFSSSNLSGMSLVSDMSSFSDDASAMASPRLHSYKSVDSLDEAW